MCLCLQASGLTSGFEVRFAPVCPAPKRYTPSPARGFHLRAGGGLRPTEWNRRCRLRASLTLAKPEVGVALPHDFVARLIAFRDDAVTFPMFGNDIAYLWEAFIGRYRVTFLFHRLV